MSEYLDTYKKQKEVPYGTHIKAVVPAKYKTTYPTCTAFQTDDLYGETRLVREEREVFGIVDCSPLIKRGVEHPSKKERGLFDEDTYTFYPFKSLRNIQICEKMTKEEKELLIKDICGRLPYGIFVKENRRSLDDFPIIYTYDYHPYISNCKPYLRPMDSMMQGEWEEMTALIYPHGRVNSNPDNKNELLLWLSAEGNDMPIILMDKVFSWLNKKGFDYRGLIPMGLALPAKEGMYNKMEE